MSTASRPSEKDGLRQAMRERLATLDPTADRAAAERLADRVLSRPDIASAGRIFVCLSFGIEIDTWGLVDRLLAAGHEVFVPRSIWRSRRIAVHRYPCPLVTLRFGLRQPASTEPEVDADQLDIALVAGLAFDRRGHRLGYGAGFFDRFLADRPFPALGIARAGQIVERLPVESHDVPMAAVVTDEETIG